MKLASKPNPNDVPQLRISEIFYSLQGETRSVGIPTVFVRLTGCPLRCTYCDTAYAFTGGQQMAMEDIHAEINKYKPSYITVTGGEPLAQKNCLVLLNQLCNFGYEVSLETSGAFDVREVDPRVIKIVDLKTPGSGEAAKNLLSNFEFLNKHDQIKFVICHREDYEWAKAILSEYKIPDRCEVLFSPSYAELAGNILADWILADRLPVRFQIQLHKILWGDVPGR